MRFNIITLFPEMVLDALSFGVIGRAIKNKSLTVVTYNPRDYAENKHLSVDDKPFGGGPGMVMMYDPLFRVVEQIKNDNVFTTLSFLSPHGKRFDQAKAIKMAQTESITLLCGRYEGVDQRFIDACVDEEISLGDFVLSGGELAACSIVDAVARMLPGVLGDETSASTDSFMNQRLGYPQYTRSELLGQSGVPGVLLSGHHLQIEEWRNQQSLETTQRKRPDLIAGTSEQNSSDSCSNDE